MPINALFGKIDQQLIYAAVLPCQMQRQPVEPCQHDHQREACKIEPRQKQHIAASQHALAADRRMQQHARHGHLVDQHRQTVIALLRHDSKLSCGKADAHHEQQHQHFLKYNPYVNHLCSLFPVFSGYIIAAAAAKVNRKRHPTKKREMQASPSQHVKEPRRVSPRRAK